MKTSPSLVSEVPFTQGLIYMLSSLIFYICSITGGAGINPAISFGQIMYYKGVMDSRGDHNSEMTKEINLRVTYLWVFIIFPLVGGALAGIFAHFLHFPMH